jgi:hypothetical protein
MARYRAPAAWLASDVHAVVRADLAPSPARWVADPALLLSVTAVRAGVYHEVFLVPARGERDLGRLASLGEPVGIVRFVHAAVDIRLREQQGQAAVADRFLGDDAFADVGPLRDVVHHLEE